MADSLPPSIRACVRCRQVNAINQLYESLWICDNFFRSVMRLKGKIITPAQNGQPSPVKRIRDLASPLFSCLFPTSAIPQDKQLGLQALCARTDPIAPLEETYELIDHICVLPNAVPGRAEDGFLTLRTSLTLRR